MRETLRSYYECGMFVKLQGIYEGPAILKGGTQAVDVGSCNVNGIPDNSLCCPWIKKGLPYGFMQEQDRASTSCLTNVKGIEDFNNINERHIILQFDVTKNQMNHEIVNVGDRIEVLGRVYQYKRKDGTEDYGIVAYRYQKVSY